MGAARQQQESSFMDTLKKFESEISTILGVLVVIVLAIGLFLLIRRSNQANVPQISDLAESTQENLMQTPRPNRYTVKAGDGLWSIAQDVYGDGYRWTEIAQANNLRAPYTLTAGQELVLPEGSSAAATSTPQALSQVPPSAPPAPTTPPEPTEPTAPSPAATSTPQSTQSPRPTSTPAASPTAQPTEGSTGASYTVTKGDSLWKIAVATYNDGYRWVEIYRANRASIGANPGIIVPGQVLTIPGK